MTDTSARTLQVIDTFNAAFQRHDPTLLPPLIALDCVLENTQPAPNGSRHVGRDACLEVWQGIASNAGIRFELESTNAYDDRAIILWRLFWGEGEANSVRGTNLMRVRDGLIVEGLGYVKGT